MSITAWQLVILEVCIELNYRRVRVGNKTSTECVLVDDYSNKKIAAPTFRACIDEYKIIMGFPIVSDDIVKDIA